MADFGFSGTGILEGMQAARTTIENDPTWGIRNAQYGIGVIDGAARDAGNTPTTELRAGLLMGKVTSTGKYKEYDPDATDGTDVVKGILTQPFRVTDVDGTNQDLKVTLLVGGSVNAARLILLDAQARAQMAEQFSFDDAAANANKFPWLAVRAKTADYTVTLADRGVCFTTDGASGAVNFTLPALSIAAKGHIFEFMSTTDNNVTVTSAAGNDIVAFNDLAASSVAISTSSKKIGLGIRIKANSAGTKWIAEYINGASGDYTLT